MIPSVQVTKLDFQTGVVPPSDTGVLCLIAPSSAGTANVPAGFTDPIALQAAMGEGPLTEEGALFMQGAKKPILAIKTSPTTPGAYGAITQVETGTGTFTGKTATHPFDAYNVVLTCVVAGTEGVAGIQWNYSLDGGQTVSPTITQTTSADFVIPNTGMSFTLSAAGTLVAGDQMFCQTVEPIMSTTDLGTSLEALRVSKAEWDIVYCDCDASSTIITQVDAWLAALEGVGVFKIGCLRTRARTRATETEAAFATAMGTAYNGSSTIRCFVGADHCDMVSASPNFGGMVIDRPFAIPLVARILSTTEEIDPAQVNLGPLPNTIIDDANLNPKWHDEAVFPGLDVLRLATARTFQGPTAPSGVFVNNCPMLSPTGSDYVYVEHARVMNKACTIAYALLVQRLSIGVRTDPTTGFILEIDALKIEQSIQQELSRQLAGQVSGITFQLSRTDDLTSNTGATVNAGVKIASIKIIKNFKVKAAFTSQ